MPFLRRQIGMIFQDHHLLMDRTVYDNVAIPLIIAAPAAMIFVVASRRRWTRLACWTKRRIFPFSSPAVSSSAWESLARWSTSRRCCWRMNRTYNLDEALSEGILRLFEEFNRVGVTVLMATHDLGLISSRPYRVLTLSDGHLHGGIRGE